MQTQIGKGKLSLRVKFIQMFLYFVMFIECKVLVDHKCGNKLMMMIKVL